MRDIFLRFAWQVTKVKTLADIPGIGGIDADSIKGEVYQTRLADVPDLKDQNGIPIAAASDLSDQAYGKWYTRQIPLAEGHYYDALFLNTKIPSDIFETDNLTAEVLYKDIFVKSSDGKVKATLFKSYNNRISTQDMMMRQEEEKNLTADMYIVSSVAYEKNKNAVIELIDKNEMNNTVNSFKVIENEKASNGTLKIEGNKVTYTPTADYAGFDNAGIEVVYDRTFGEGAVEPNHPMSYRFVFYEGKPVIPPEEPKEEGPQKPKPIDGDYIEITVTASKAASETTFVNYRIGDLGYTVTPGDKLEYDVFLVDAVKGIGGVDMYSTVYNKRFSNMDNLNNIVAPDLTENANGKWYHVSQDLPADAGYVDFVGLSSRISDSSITNGTYTVLYDNIKITNKGKIMKNIFKEFNDRIANQEALMKNEDDTKNGHAEFSFVISKQVEVNSSNFAYNLPVIDAQGGKITYEILTDAVHGKASVSGDLLSMKAGYVPKKNYLGEDMFIVKQNFDVTWVQNLTPGAVYNPKYKPTIKFLIDVTKDHIGVPPTGDTATVPVALIAAILSAGIIVVLMKHKYRKV